MKHGSFPSRGAAPVSHLGELSAIEASAVIYWRLWAEGAEGQRRVQLDFCDGLGDASGEEAVQALAGIADLCRRHGRRPLMRHGLGCKCVGADENCFANFIGYASECRREDAALIASLMVDPNLCLPLAAMAQTFGLALRRMILAPLPAGVSPTNTNITPTSKTIH